MFRTFATCTLGCKVNQYETDAMEQMLLRAGYEKTDFKEAADIYIINTCSVTNMADKKSRQMIHRAKKKNPNRIAKKKRRVSEKPLGSHRISLT